MNIKNGHYVEGVCYITRNSKTNYKFQKFVDRFSIGVVCVNIRVIHLYFSKNLKKIQSFIFFIVVITPIPKLVFYINFKT